MFVLTINDKMFLFNLKIKFLSSKINVANNEIYCVAFKVSFACKAIIIKTFKKRSFAFN